MSKVVFVLVAAFAVSCQFALAQQEECKDNFNLMRQKFKENSETEEFSCFGEYQLDRFLCTEDDVSEEDQEAKQKEFIDWLKEVPEETQPKVMECAARLVQKSIEDCGDELREECLNLIKENMAKMGKSP